MSRNPAVVAFLDQAWAQASEKLDAVIEAHRDVLAEGDCDDDLLDLLGFLIGHIGAPECATLLAVAVDRVVRRT